MSMAEVSNLHRLNHLEEEGGELYNHHNAFVLDFDSFSPPNNSFFGDYTASFNLGFDLNENLGCDYDDPNCLFYGAEEDEEQMNFVTDLFEARETHVPEDSILEFGSVRDEVSVSALEFGFGPGLGGLRVTGMDSESDSEEFEVTSGFVDNNIIDVDDDEYGITNASNYQISENEREEFEWEEVSERFHSDERENLNSVIDRIEEITVSSDISSSESEESEEGVEEERNIEWEVLLAMNNLERSFEFENSEENNQDGGEIPRVNLPEDYILTMEYDTLFVENENALKGSPPAAKLVVENLPMVVLTKEEVEENNSAVICAVCKDEVAVGEKVIRMPCCHLYHGDCILPWLRIRNTCPVCRYELPTDDADYEKRRIERGGSGMDALLVNDLEGRNRVKMIAGFSVEPQYHANCGNKKFA